MTVVIRVLLGICAAALCFVTALPVSTSNEWWVRACDFPRMQLSIAIVVVLAGYVAMWVCERALRRRRPARGGVEKRDAGRGWRGSIRAHSGKVLPGMLLVALVWQCVQIFPYTPLASVQMESARGNSSDDGLKIFILNVRFDNRRFDALLRVVDEYDPDVVLLVEPTAWWEEQLRPLMEAYEYAILQPQENHYGVLLYSRLELIAPEVRFLTDGEVPSVRTGVRLRSGRVVELYGLHPKPPGLKRPVDTEREDSDQRDAELVMVAKEVDALGDVPVIVAGDFNDVAWSHTTRLFQRVSGLLDPRIGRGLFNTYKTDSRFTRFPLDHVFASKHFRLVELRVLDGIGSDHHPVVVTLRLEPDAPISQDEPTPNPGDMEEVAETIDDASEGAE